MEPKLIFKLFIGLWAACSLVACEKDYEVYDAELSAVRFMLKQKVDSTLYSFALMPGVEIDTLEIPVQILGFTSARDREVNITVDPELSTAREDTHFSLESCRITAGETTGKQRVIIHKTADLDEKAVYVSLKICDSPDLLAGPVNERYYRIILTDKLTRPSDWLRQFGEYSVVKHRFIIEVTGKGTNYSEWRRMAVIYQLSLLNDALFKYNNAHPGYPLTDENGIPITFPVY